MALAHVDPGLALGALAELSAPPPPGVPAQLWVLPRDLVSRARQETFTRLDSVGACAAAETIIDAVRDDLGFGTQAFDDAKVFSTRPGYTLSALYSVGMLTRNHMRDRGAAASLFADVRAACQARLAELPRACPDQLLAAPGAADGDGSRSSGRWLHLEHHAVADLRS